VRQCIHTVPRFVALRSQVGRVSNESRRLGRSQPMRASRSPQPVGLLVAVSSLGGTSALIHRSPRSCDDRRRSFACLTSIQPAVPHASVRKRFWQWDLSRPRCVSHAHLLSASPSATLPNPFLPNHPILIPNRQYASHNLYAPFYLCCARGRRAAEHSAAARPVRCHPQHCSCTCAPFVVYFTLETDPVLQAAALTMKTHYYNGGMSDRRPPRGRC
jgi:hypothetical protein